MCYNLIIASVEYEQQVCEGISIKMERKVYSNDLKMQIVKLYERGMSQQNISDQFQIHKSIISRILKRYRIRKTVAAAPRTGRPRKTSARDDNAIIRQIKRNPWATSSEIRSEIGANVSSRTIRRRLVERGFYSRRPARKPLLKKKQRMARLQFAQDHLTWDVKKWKTVLFSDESKFNITDTDGIKYVRRPDGQRLNPRYYKTTVKHGGGSVMVWACFSGQGMGPLHRIHGIMDRFMYKDTLQNVMLPYAEEEMPLRWIFQQDNDPKLTAKIVTQWLGDNNVRILSWPAQSPDLNPIENLWDIVNRQIRQNGNILKADQLFVALSNAWMQISPTVIENLISSMPKRCAAVIQNKGYATKY